MTMKKALQTSFMLHFLTFWLMGGAPIGCSGGSGSGDSAKKAEQEAQGQTEAEKEEIVEKEKDGPVEVTLIEQTQEERDAMMEKAARKEIAECEPHFGGIGIEHNPRTGVISKVFKYYPAYDAGLQVGDQILTPINTIKGEIGTPLELTFMRAGQVYSVTIIRGRICTKDAPKPKGFEP